MLIILNVIWNIFQDYQIFHDALNKTYKQNFSYYHEIFVPNTVKSQFMQSYEMINTSYHLLTKNN